MNVELCANLGAIDQDLGHGPSVVHADRGMSGRRLAADAVGHRCRAGQESSEASAVIAATSSWVSWMRAAARFSVKCRALVVPGIGSAFGVR
jgi:hypothetical protein